MQFIQIRPQRGGDCGKGGAVRRLFEGLRLGGLRQQELFQECGAGKVGRARVGDGAGVLSGPGQQRLRICQRFRQGLAAGDKGELCAAPWRLCPLGRDGKIFRHRFGGVDITPVRERLCPSGLQQPGGFQGAEVLAVDPEQVDGTVGVAPGAGLGLDAFHRIGGIRQTDNLQGNGVVAFYFATHPVQVAVHRRIAAPGVKPDGLAPGLLFHFLPAVISQRVPCDQQASQKHAQTHTAHNAPCYEDVREKRANSQRVASGSRPSKVKAKTTPGERISRSEAICPNWWPALRYTTAPGSIPSWLTHQ